ncbi:delta-aminolevulinic acid dehydratase [Paenibacillus apiarius]|uniref:Delta-aminolevulinic acid dehydratase n=1 Tax=Paenibacillus apiarius TaxID=46240 RepID=A0ABT4DXU3_9BACL|nr:delta-aminolevulinic acid dehydratase [Paenibacillus apiarius]MCY9517554.1 delta-aminolevulinic acid dehydratase [Paenibacillus apiarius]MCY9522167.1 delta-aminolevulinic acid dehydratase [Paenibacillus apiarius]MCY9552201.1 delta-aminolevulinic acid dehydratase [Paenibacillus apiarius]MCY9560080.1 delta-aminolevulinic acid dehydratase [Paenibacillus apiarius]MCY9683698.1 delta-aminolevulinic acid dehydratase [Paenibacillus apiarius]
MSKPEMNVALVCGPDCDMDTQAIRAALEYFGARVFMYWVGRPSDFMSVLSGEDIYPGTELIILNFHGDEGKFVMPELGESVYEEGEPRDDFGPAEIRRFANLDGRTILANGCDLGNAELAQAFLECGCKTYIGPNDYPDGNAALMFALRFCYELIQHKKSIRDAYHIARATDDDTTMYQIYEQ